MTNQHGLIVVGGSYAALNIVIGAREAGYGGPIRLFSAERSLPYQRPPLSKAYLQGRMDEALLPLRNEAFYRSQEVELCLGGEIVAIDRAERRIVTAGGGAFAYDRLALATGARARALPVPGAELAGIASLRSLDDAQRLRREIAAARRVVVVGGGFIGLEAAASLRSLGKEVAVLEYQERLLGRAMSGSLAAFMADVHRGHGVTVECGVRVVGFQGSSGRVAAVATDDRLFPADLVIVGVGSLPNIELAQRAGLACRNGILVDRSCRTSDPAIFAAGDCTRHPSRHSLDLLRLESVQNATEQGRAAGAAMAGKDIAYDALPWFWSDQFDLKLQTAGLIDGSDRVVRRGSPEAREFSQFHYRGAELVAVESVNRPGDHMLARKLLNAGIHPPAEQAADLAVDLRELV